MSNILLNLEIIKLKAAHEAEVKELMNELFEISKKSEAVHRENAQLRSELARVGDVKHLDSMDAALRGEMGEYKRGWYSAMQNISERIAQILKRD